MQHIETVHCDQISPQVLQQETKTMRTIETLHYGPFQLRVVPELEMCFVVDDLYQLPFLLPEGITGFNNQTQRKVETKEGRFDILHRSVFINFVTPEKTPIYKGSSRGRSNRKKPCGYALSPPSITFHTSIKETTRCNTSKPFTATKFHLKSCNRRPKPWKRPPPPPSQPPFNHLTQEALTS